VQHDKIGQKEGKEALPTKSWNTLLVFQFLAHPNNWEQFISAPRKQSSNLILNMTTIFIVHIAFEQLREMKQMRTGENYILRNIYI